MKGLYIHILMESHETHGTCGNSRKLPFVCSKHVGLDKFWMHQDVMYDFAADLTGIGDRSVREIIIVSICNGD